MPEDGVVKWGGVGQRVGAVGEGAGDDEGPLVPVSCGLVSGEVGGLGGGYLGGVGGDGWSTLVTGVPRWSWCVP